MQSSQETHLSPILHLPLALRRQIYSHFHDALGRTQFSFYLHGRNSKAALRFHALLLSCRTVYDEVSQLLYSSNRFVVKSENANGLRPLRMLNGASVAALTELKIVLNEVSCNDSRCIGCCNDHIGISEGPPCPSICMEGHVGWHDQALRPSHHSGNKVLEDWSSTSACIWSWVCSTKLNISLVCDFDPEDPRTPWDARLAVAPLVNLSPLRGCHIRLCKTPHHELEQIARKSVFQARAIADPEEPVCTLRNAAAGSGSMLMSLPRELRFRILEYTDLITPWKEVRWSREHRGYLPSLVHCNYQDCPAKLHHGCQFRRCWTGFVSPEFGDPRPQVGCFCRIRHAAFSFNCRCWSPPTDLFLVCRTLYKDAQVVFFSGNRFVVHDHLLYTPWNAPSIGEYPYDRFAVSEFLRNVMSIDCLHLIRSLEISFPPYDHEVWPRDGCLALQDWVETIRLIKERINLGGLTLRLTMFDAPGSSGWPEAREDMTKPQAREILQAYTRILAPLAGLGEDGLKRFYAHLALPEKWTSWVMNNRSAGGNLWQHVHKKERKLNERAEALVMGGRYGEQPEDEFYWNREPVNSVWRRGFIDLY